MTDPVQSALADTHEAIKLNGLLLHRLKACLRALESGFHALPDAPEEAQVATTNEHLRTHKPGRPSRIDTDAELNAFVIERIETMTFEGLAAEIRANFLLDRRVGKSALHNWYQKNKGVTL